MIVIPAVDLRDGRCVRLRQGRADQETVFSDDPVAMARGWAQAGAARLHVVDLDGAFVGSPRQTAIIAAIAAAVAPVAVQAGGGLRDVAAVETMLDTGARWAVVGTRAALDPGFLADVGRRFPDRIVVAVDGKGPQVAVKGWTETAEATVVDVAQRARDAGAAAVLYTDVSRDGTGDGPNVEATAALARAVALPVLASGGVGSIDDLLALAAIPGVAGTVVGRALYTGAIDLRQALDSLSSSAGSARATDPGGRQGGASRQASDDRRKGGEAPLRA
ncbi:MAG: 1-(5-phosphoribosyl)-5-[(5-phosphoribosylamino)methylideneamino]imidazole-4-carboxamide isomerase [Candidatus Rokuibacteriota bacterium]